MWVKNTKPGRRKSRKLVESLLYEAPNVNLGCMQQCIEIKDEIRNNTFRTRKNTMQM